MVRNDKHRTRLSVDISTALDDLLRVAAAQAKLSKTKYVEYLLEKKLTKKVA